MAKKFPHPGPGCGISEPRGVTQASATDYYYCLDAWDGYIYSYPWDDRPSALAYAWPASPSLLTKSGGR